MQRDEGQTHRVRHGTPLPHVVVRTRDNQTVYDQVKTLVYKSNFPPQLADELVFPSNENTN